MVQSRCRAGLASEALDGERVIGRRSRERFHRHMSSERFLNRLVHDPHA
jgi:hypothetical protein